MLLISVTYGNIDVQNCLRNVVTMFYHIEKELAWRKENGLKLGFDTLRHHKPLVAVGPEHPLADQILMADYFRTQRLPDPIVVDETNATSRWERRTWWNSRKRT